MRYRLAMAGWAAFVTAVPLVFMLELVWRHTLDDGSTASRQRSLAIGGNTTCAGCVCISACEPSGFAPTRFRCSVDQGKCPEAHTADSAWDHCSFGGCPDADIDWSVSGESNETEVERPNREAEEKKDVDADAEAEAEAKAKLTEEEEGLSVTRKGEAKDVTLSLPAQEEWDEQLRREEAAETPGWCDGVTLSNRAVLCQGVIHGSEIQASVCKYQAEDPCRSDLSLTHNALEKANVTLIRVRVPVGHALLGTAIDDFLTRNPEFFIRSIPSTSDLDGAIQLARHMKPSTRVSFPTLCCGAVLNTHKGACRFVGE